MNQVERFFASTYPENTFNDVLLIFLKKQSQKISEHTVSRLFYNLRPIGEELGNPDIRELDRNWVKKYVDKLWLRYAPDTMRTKVGDIRQFFKWCKKKGYLSKNIAKRIKPLRRRHRHRRVKAASEADVRQLIGHLARKTKHRVYRDLFGTLQAAPKHEWSNQEIKYLRDLFIVIFLYETGARAGELSTLGSYTMTHVVENVAPSYTITVIGKTDDRDYMFTNRTAELWRVWQQVRPSRCQEYAVIGWGKAHPHSRIKTNGISQMLVRRCEESEIRPFRAHALRHAKVKRGRHLVGLEITSQLIDHSRIDTTRGYANIDEDELATAAVKTGLQYDPWE